jgi:hypothetical protein
MSRKERTRIRRNNYRAWKSTETTAVGTTSGTIAKLRL